MNSVHSPNDDADAGDFVPRPMLTMPPESGFGARVQAVRSHYRLNVEALSRLTKAYDEPDRRGVSGAAISRYEAGDALPGLREFRILVEALGVPAEWMLMGTIPVNGKTEAQQQLMAALLKVIGEQREDINVGGTRLSESIEYQTRLQRRARIAEARKPT